MRKFADPLGAASRLAALCQSGTDAKTVWGALDSVLAEVFGHTLFTVLLYDSVARRLVRTYSSRPDVNPVGGIKPVTPSAWTSRVLVEGAPYIGRSREDLREVFPDYETLWAIGCESVLNIPVRHEGVVVGSLNLLAGPANYDASDVGLACLFAQLVTTSLLADRAVTLDAASC